ncbi:MAG: NAD-binding protein [Fuerstiella sp.]|nr:NAD-binding protein [Fuerstiella sp.]
MRRLIQIPLLLLATLLVGALGLRLLTNQPILDCFYQAVILLTTVGSQEPVPLTPATKIFVVVFLTCGVGVFTYSAYQYGQIIVSGDLRSFLERRRMQKVTDQLSDHFIICGYGRMGATLCDYLHRRKQSFVIVDENPDLMTDEMKADGWLFMHGDATQDQILIEAGVTRARGLTTVLPTDADNLYVVLSSRLLAKDLQIVARGSDERAAEKMQRAGATRVINPLSSGAIRMARLMLSPSIENFIEVAESHGIEWEIADVQVPDDSPLVHRQLKETPLRQAGIILLGICKSSGETHFPPEANMTIEAGDSLFAFGTSEKMLAFPRLLDGDRVN